MARGDGMGAAWVTIQLGRGGAQACDQMDVCDKDKSDLARRRDKLRHATPAGQRKSLPPSCQISVPTIDRIPE
jgi:hypothetical protein